ncbi:MAG TPA: amino acid permease [Symbiobacteriaceae bacterium]|jgi:basic amino acid/polyamine antiporter, APA family|nr:amino acid permease [Symbiobacteriaceae bacterium]
MQQPPQLRRDLGLSHAMLTVIGTVIGSGIFALPAVVFARAAAPGLGIAAWLIGGLISLAAALTVAELSAAMPTAGGTFQFLRAAYGPWMGFLQGWSMFLAYNSAMQAALAMIFTSYLSALIPISQTSQTVIGIALILALTAINAVGVRFGGLIQVVSTLGKLLPIALLILFGFSRIDTANLGPFLPTDGGLFAALGGALLPVLWAYDGWIITGQLSEEVRNPQRTIPLALIGGIAFVTVIYTIFNVVLAGAIPMETLTASEKPVIPLATLLFGEGGAKLITVGMLVSMFGTLNAIVMTAPRYTYAMARDGLFPGAKQMAQLHPKYQTPVAALMISCAWSIVLLLSGQFGQLLNLVVFVGWLFYIFVMVGVFILRRTRPEMDRPYKAWGYPVVPLIGIGSGIWLLVNTVVTDPRTAFIGLGLTLTGLPVYMYLRRNQKAK